LAATVAALGSPPFGSAPDADAATSAASSTNPRISSSPAVSGMLRRSRGRRNMAKVTGLGGLFYKVRDPDATRAWYEATLGIGGEWGATFPLEAGGYSLLSPFKADSDYFAPSELPFMVNLRVDDLDGLLAALKEKGVEPLGRQDESYGKFAWIVDPDGLKIELWEQVGPSPV